MAAKKHSDKKGVDRLGELLGELHPNRRHDIWLFLYLFYHRETRLDLQVCNGQTMRDALARTLASQKLLIPRLAGEKDRYLLPDKKLEWIKDDERQHAWLLPKLERLSGFRIPRRATHLVGRDSIIATIDIWELDLDEKDSEIDFLRKDWLRHKANDGEFDWFADKKDGEKRCACAWEWIEKNYLSPISRQTPITNHQELLTFFDNEGVGRSERAAMIREIKRRWSRKQFDVRSADKKQINVLLSKTVVTLLDGLAEKHGIKRAKIIEKLIEMESGTGVYLDSIAD